MKNLQAKFVGFVKKHKILSIILVLVVALCAWWAYASFIPHPLGNKMVYLGKEDSGNIFGFDEAPYSTYYYGTDMSVEEVEKYFKNTKVEYPSENMGEYTEIWLKNQNSNHIAVLYYYSSPPSNTPHHTNKKHIIEMRNEHYDTLRKDL